MKKKQKKSWKRTLIQIKEVGFVNTMRLFRRRRNKHVVMNDALSSYVEKMAENTEPNMIAEFRKASLQIEMNEMQIDSTEAGFLKLLVHITHARRVLEIGTFRGWSAAVMAQALVQNEIESKENYVSRLVTVECRPDQAKIAKSLWEKHLDSVTASRIHLVVKTARDFFKIINEGPGIQSETISEQDNLEDYLFDLVFIDADKAGYAEYLMGAKRLVNIGGLIILDNMLNAGLVATKADDRANHAIKSLNHEIFISKSYDIEGLESYMIPAWDGVVILRRTV